MGPGGGPDDTGAEDSDRADVSERAAFSALLEDSAEDLYENAPCGYLSTLLDGQIAKINTTLLGWLGHTRDELVGRRRFSDLLSVGGRLYHETHFAPLLRMQGELGGIALDMVAADGRRLPVLVTSTVKHGTDGQPLLIRTTVFDASDRRAYERELLRAREEATGERDRANHELERVRHLATTLQRSLLPPKLPSVPGLRAAAHYHHASPEQVGGDFYDLFPLSRQRWAFFLGDVCGKGAPAASVTSLTRYTLRSAAAYDSDPVAVLSNLNSVLYQEFSFDDPRFTTVIFGVLTPTPDGFEIELASGGHPPALVIRADGTVDYQHIPGGQLVGILPDPYFGSASVLLRPGDTLLLYTAGLTEARTGVANTRYDEDALHEFVTGHAPTTAPALIEAVAGLFAQFGDGLEDDAAALALSVPTLTTPPTP